MHIARRPFLRRPRLKCKFFVMLSLKCPKPVQLAIYDTTTHSERIHTGTGYAIVIINVICSLYYNVIIAYPIVFIWKSMSATLPWMSCNNPWNTPNCIEVTALLALIALLPRKTPSSDAFVYTFFTAFAGNFPQLAKTSSNATDYLAPAANLSALSTTQFKTPADEFFQ